MTACRFKDKVPQDQYPSTEFGALRKLILVKHAAPEVIPGLPPEQWTLSEKGRVACVPLADRLAGHELTRIVSSEEPKAAETARLVAERLNVPWRTAPGLHEHDRSNVPHMRSGEFISMMELFFRRPDELVLGRETANQAKQRFKVAMQRVIEQDAGSIAIVSHGTVIALLLRGDDPGGAYRLWRGMALPSYVAVSLPDFEVQEAADRIA
jgi:broad specificity phosphatase PhoE